MAVGLHKTAQRRGFVSVLACLYLVVSMSQGVVLCVGSDGRAAPRPTLHTHCHHDIDTDASNGAHAAEDAHQHEANEHCGRCLDIPLSLCTSQGHPQIGHGERACAWLAHVSEASISVERIGVSGLPTEGLFRKTPYFSALRSVVLLV